LKTTVMVALITVGGTLGGALLALIGTLITQRVTGQREDKRREHEREIKRIELEDSRRERRRDERLDACQKFYAACNSMLLFMRAKQRNEATPEYRKEVLQEIAVAMSLLDLVVPSETKSAADEMVRAVYAIDEPPESLEALEKKGDIFCEIVRDNIGQRPDNILHIEKSS
jgi:hypothetical protein